jgi:DNA modification methylase
VTDQLTILTGDCRETLKTLPDASVHCCVTSPPYFGLRSYGIGSDNGELGLEPTPDEYVANMVAVFREVRRVLRDDGTLWLNLGDSYAGSGKGAGNYELSEKQRINNGANYLVVETAREAAHTMTAGMDRNFGLKPKDLIGIPWRVAFALQADGWWLRSDIVWAKPNGMPESVTDRPTRAHEYVFLLSKSARYFYDHAAVRLPPLPQSIERMERAVSENHKNLIGAPGQTPHSLGKPRENKQRGHSRRHDGFNDRWDAMEKEHQQANGAALRDVWWLAPAQCKDSHFAVMPDTLAKVCILAGCPVGGTVLDPFGGSGTTALVANMLGRKAILCELNPKYVELMHERRQETAPLLLATEAA